MKDEPQAAHQPSPMLRTDLRLEICDGAPEALLDRYLRFPAEQSPRLGDIRLSLLRIVRGWQWFENDLAGATCQPLDLPGKLDHCPFGRITNIDRTALLRVDQPPEAVDQ